MEVYWFPIVDPRKTCVSVIMYGERLVTDPDYCSGLGEKRHLVRCSSPPSCCNLFILRKLIRRPGHYGFM
jgi:hypothetical protein